MTDHPYLCGVHIVSDIPAAVRNQAVNWASIVTKKIFAIFVIFPCAKPKRPLRAATNETS